MFATQLLYIFLPHLHPSSYSRERGLLASRSLDTVVGLFRDREREYSSPTFIPPPTQGVKTLAWHLQCWPQYSPPPIVFSPSYSTYNVGRNIPPPYCFFPPPTQGLKTMAWHLQCWLQYNATEPRGCISVRFSAPGATALVPRHKKSACKSSLMRQICSPTAP